MNTVEKKKSYRATCKAAAQALTIKQRQELLDRLWDGETLGEAYEDMGISLNAAFGIVNANTTEKPQLRRKVAW